jgi:hypothetical protein
MMQIVLMVAHDIIDDSIMIGVEFLNHRCSDLWTFFTKNVTLRAASKIAAR